MYRILIADPLAPAGLEILREAGAEVVELEPDRRAELPGMLPEFDAMVVRSGTTVTPELLEAGEDLDRVPGITRWHPTDLVRSKSGSGSGSGDPS